jgi:hypothetical protein
MPSIRYSTIPGHVIHVYRICYCTVLYCMDTVVVSYSYVQYSNTPLSRDMFRIAHMATPAPRCSCCYAQRKSRGPEGHGDGNFLVLLLQNACFRLPHCRPAHSCRPSKGGKALASAAGVCTDGSDVQRPRECVLEDCTRFDLRGLSHTPPTFRGPDLGHLTDLCPRGLVGFAVNAEDERPDNPELASGASICTVQ